MSEYSDAIQSQYAMGPALAGAAINDDPNQAARALDLSATTGVPAAAISGDLKGFELQHRFTMAAEIVRSNPRLNEYVRSHPLAASVSNDDLANLDAFSQGADYSSKLVRSLNYPLSVVKGAAQGAYEGAKEGVAGGFGSEPIGRGMADSQQTRLGYAVAQTGWGALDLALRSGQAVLGGVMGAATGAAGGGGEAAVGPSFGRDLRAITEYEMTKGEGHVEAPHIKAQIAAKPWTDAGIEPPSGLHPAIDAVKVQANAEALTQLEQNFQAATASATRERSPELFRQFVQQHYGQSEIGINGDVAVGLYARDEVPAPGDGKLGFVPGIADQLAISRETGADVKIPISDWITHAEPGFASSLHDDIRMWPGGITAREAAIAPDVALWSGAEVPRPEAPVALAREAMSSEPLHGIGDRQLFMRDGGVYDIQGQRIGDLAAHAEGENLRLDQMSVDPDTMGPSLLTDLRRQMATEFPGVRTLEGLPLNENSSAAFAQIRSALEGAYWKSVGGGIEGNFVPLSQLGAEHQALARSVLAEINKQTGGRAGVNAVAGIRDVKTGHDPLGVFLQYRDRIPRIMVDLFGDDPVGAARHEGIHLLRRGGMISQTEWEALTKAADEGRWRDKHQIVERYGQTGISPEAMTEEAVAEEYRDWAASRGQPPSSVVKRVFERMARFWSGVKDRFGRLTGRSPTSKDIFERIYSGEVGQREFQPLNPKAYAGERIEPVFQLPPAAREELEAIKASSAGLDTASWRRLRNLIHARFEEDIEASIKRQAAIERRQQSAEWKTNEVAVRAEVAAAIRNRPDVATDLLLSKGELFGESVGQRPRLLDSALSPEQRAGLPEHYYGPEGLHPDAVGNLFGYSSGDAMIEKLVAYNAAKEGRGPSEMIDHVTKTETARQMEARYGQLEQNVMEAARDHALSENSLELMSEELRAAGQQAGTPTIDSRVLKEWVKTEASKQVIGSLSSDHWINMIGRHGRDAERALIAGDPAKAVVSLQRKYVAGLFASEARQLEREVARFDRQAKSLSKRVIPGVEPEYANYTHQILQQIGKPVQRSIQDVAQSIEHGASTTLEDFVAANARDLRELPVWPQLYDTTWRKPYAQLTAEEFRAIRDTVKTLIHNGRDVGKINRAGAAEEFAAVREELRGALAQFPELSYDTRNQRSMGPIPKKWAAGLRTFKAMHVQIETMLNHWDSFDPKGPWNQVVMRPLVEAANQKDAWIKETAEAIRAAKDKVDLNRQIENEIFRKQVGDSSPLKLSRGNLRAIMLNVGTESNLQKLAAGYGLKPEDVLGWIHQRATKEDWEWSQKIWDIFDTLKGRADTMYRSLSGGVAPESIEARALATDHGTYKGGYYPIIYDEEGQRSKALIGKSALEEEGFQRATTPAGYTKSRTQYVGPISLNIDQMPNRMKQIIHDTAMRPAVIQADKVFRDPRILGDISGRYGKEYKDLLQPYLRDVANNSNFMSRAQRTASAVGENIRQNLVSVLVGFNPGTVLKHGPTALIQSIHEVGAGDFAHAVKGLLAINDETGETNWQFAMNASQELQRRHQHYEETLSGAIAPLVSTTKYDSLRRTIMRYASSPVAFSDLLSAVPTWNAAYNRAMAAGESYGDSVYLADRAVRRAHGSTAVTNRPSVMREWSPWLTSVYGFFNHILNRQMEMVWHAGVHVGEVREGQYGKAMAAVPAMAGMAFAYAVWPALVEHLVQGESPNEKNMSWESKAALALLQTGGASWAGVRDLTSAIAFGRDPTLGLGGTALKSVADIARDFRKDRPFSKDHAGRMIQDAAIMVGTLTGLVHATEGKAARFAFDVSQGLEHPHGPWEWVKGFRYGTLKGHQ